MGATTVFSQPTPAIVAVKSRAATWIGLFISLFGLLILRGVTRIFWANPRGVTAVTVHELLSLALAAGLLIFMKKVEGVPLRSIGLGTSRWWKSIAWGLVMTVACAITAASLALLTRYGHSAAAEAFSRLPVWVLTLVVFRAGTVEELFYRGYAIERLQALGLKRWMAALAPLVIFAGAHWTGGAANILIAFAVGGVLTLFYLWRRDLTANMIAHFLIDFVGNVLPKLLGV